MGATKEQIEKDAKEFQKYILNNKGIAEQAIINIKNPKNLTVKDWFDNYDNSSSLKENSDGLLLKGGKQSDNRIYDAGENQIVVFEPEQIHILGSKQDIEGFKNWVSSTPQPM
jgi:gamma-glutamyl-gamma-aminobutyrate hydrolase PuuD